MTTEHPWDELSVIKKSSWFSLSFLIFWMVGVGQTRKDKYTMYFRFVVSCGNFQLWEFIRFEDENEPSLEKYPLLLICWRWSGTEFPEIPRGGLFSRRVHNTNSVTSIFADRNRARKAWQVGNFELHKNYDFFFSSGLSTLKNFMQELKKTVWHSKCYRNMSAACTYFRL